MSEREAPGPGGREPASLERGVFLVFNPASSRHYRTSMRNRSSLA